MGFLLLGGPGETRESVEQSLAFADLLNQNGYRAMVPQVGQTLEIGPKKA